MFKLPIVSGDRAIAVFKKLGYRVVRQRGSHVRMHHFSDKFKEPLTIPRHRTLGKGLLRKILRDAEINVYDFLKLL